MKTSLGHLTVIAAYAALALSRTAAGQSAAGTLAPSSATPNKVTTRIGTLDFKDGAPNQETIEKTYDNLDFTHAFNAFDNTMQGVSVAAIRGFLDAGVKDNEVLIFAELMDCQVAVHHRERRHAVFLEHHRPLQGPDGPRDAAQGPWGHR